MAQRVFNRNYETVAKGDMECTAVCEGLQEIRNLLNHNDAPNYVLRHWEDLVDHFHIFREQLHREMAARADAQHKQQLAYKYQRHRAIRAATCAYAVAVNAALAMPAIPIQDRSNIQDLVDAAEEDEPVAMPAIAMQDLEDAWNAWPMPTIAIAMPATAKYKPTSPTASTSASSSSVSPWPYPLAKRLRTSTASSTESEANTSTASTHESEE